MIRPTFCAHPLLILTVAFMLRLGWAVLVPLNPVSDSILYDAFAQSIAAGHGYAFIDGTMTEYWPVGTSWIYASVYWTFGIFPMVVPLFQVLLGTLIVWLTWKFAREILGGTVAALAGWLTAGWPILIEFTTILASELIFIALVLTSLNIWISHRLPFVTRILLWAGCVAGATYVRPTAWPLLLIFPAAQFIADRNWRTLFFGTLLAAATASLIFAPWAYRSMLLFDRLVLVSANGGVNLWMGNNPQSDGGYMELPDRKFANEVDRDRYYGGEAVKFIGSHPLKYAELSVKRTVTTYSRETIGIVWNSKSISLIFGQDSLATLKAVSSVYWWIMLIAGVIGAAVIVRRRITWRVWPLLLSFSYFAIFPILTVAMDRYHMPIDPLLAIFAAYGVAVLSGIEETSAPVQ